MRKWIIIGMLAFIVIAIVDCKKDDNSDEETAQTEREKVIKEYKDNFSSVDTTKMLWTGDAANCEAGKISQNFQNKTLKRINYYRTLAGLPGDVYFDETLNAKCQEGALMCHANNQLNHTPPKTWKCYTDDGYSATSHSNLASGSTGAGAIITFMQDYGASNTACGHRRWILYPKVKYMGHGSTSSYDCLWVIGNNKPSYPSNMPQFISWPSKSYFPAPLVSYRWSFSVPSANFQSTTVSMTDAANKNISLNIVSYKDNGYGDNTIVWEPTGIITNSKNDVTYKVKVNNVVVSGNTRNYEYTVIIVPVTG